MVTRRGTAYEVTRTFNSLPAAMAGVAALGEIVESAYTPKPAPELPPHVAELLERCDEDWWRNPRSGPWLQGLWARGGAVTAATLPSLVGGGEASLEGWARTLVARL